MSIAVRAVRLCGLNLTTSDTIPARRLSTRMIAPNPRASGKSEVQYYPPRLARTLTAFLCRTCATRIGGTVSLVHTGKEFIPANTPVYWKAPEKTDVPVVVKGMPQDAVYPLLMPYQAETLTSTIADALIDSGNTTNTASEKAALELILRRKLSAWSRVIGWTLNE